MGEKKPKLATRYSVGYNPKRVLVLNIQLSNEYYIQLFEGPFNIS